MRAWLDLSCGASGDMLLGALLDVGADLDVVQSAVAALGVPVSVSAAPACKHGVPATQVTVHVHEDQPPQRTWYDVKSLLEAADLHPAVRAGAQRVFATLAEAEGVAHGTPADEVHFHEVGAHDAIADIVGVIAAAHNLGLQEVCASEIALGGGSVWSAHGRLDVPVPAVQQIVDLRHLPSRLGPVDVELCTPTGAALLAELVTRWTDEPPPGGARTGSGSGTRELADRANVLTVHLWD